MGLACDTNTMAPASFLTFQSFWFWSLVLEVISLKTVNPDNMSTNNQLDPWEWFPSCKTSKQASKTAQKVSTAEVQVSFEQQSSLKTAYMLTPQLLKISQC